MKNKQIERQNISVIFNNIVIIIFIHQLRNFQSVFYVNMKVSVLLF